MVLIRRFWMIRHRLMLFALALLALSVIFACSTLMNGEEQGNAQERGNSEVEVPCLGCLTPQPGQEISLNETSVVQEVFTDDWSSGWDSAGSWDTDIVLENSSPIHSGSTSVQVTHNKAWGGMYLHINDVVDIYPGYAVRFWIHGGGSGGQQLKLFVQDAGYNSGGEVPLTSPAANTWSEVMVPFDELGAPSSIHAIALMDAAGSAQPAYYLDDIAIVQTETDPSPPPQIGPSLQVDAASGRHAISPFIYGINFAEEGIAAELNLPVNRWGGNATTRYSWQNDTSNRASDWYFENIPNDNPSPGDLPDGSSSDRFVEQNLNTGSKTLLTVPLIGWTPKSREVACGFSVSKYGTQQDADPWNADCGNGYYSNGSPITGNAPQDTSMAVGPDFVQEWISHLIGRYGAAGSGGVTFYNLDNEPMLWHHTHRDVHPDPAGYDETRDRAYAYGAAVKTADPGAQTLGPVVWGWTAYFYSGIDAESGNWSNPPDRNAHGGVPYVPWYLGQMQAYEQTNGVRILDYLDLHYYPQAPGVALSSAGDSSTQALRLRSTRSLWDPSYSDESWIDEPVNLIPRMRAWVEQYYPGTKLAITEYNWGALDHLNGALTQADVLGIFGREGLDLATLWASLGSEDPWAYAFRMYRNYDGEGSAFGETSVSAASSDETKLAIYAAERDADGALTVMVINKSADNLTSTVNLSGFSPASSAEVYRYSVADLHAVTPQADQAISSAGFTATYPRESITLIVLEPGSAPEPTPGPSFSFFNYIPVALR